jgi:hypothetical protein
VEYFRGVVVVLHETIHNLHMNKMGMVLFKKDFKKADDEVRWYFSQASFAHERFYTDVVQFGSRGFVQGGVLALE